MELFRGFVKSNKGQFAIEAILLMIIMMGAFMALTQTLQKKQVVQKFTESSVNRVKKMTELGTWKDTCKPIGGSGQERAANCHPNSINRSLSSAPD